MAEQLNDEPLSGKQQQALWLALARALEMIAGGCQLGARAIRDAFRRDA